MRFDGTGAHVVKTPVVGPRPLNCVLLGEKLQGEFKQKRNMVSSVLKKNNSLEQTPKFVPFEGLGAHVPNAPHLALWLD